MNYYSEQDIREIVEAVIRQSDRGLSSSCPAPETAGQEIPVEISARHVHLTREALEALFGRDGTLTQKRDLSQPGQFLAAERVKIVTEKGELANVAVLGPLRSAVQVELSATDARTLGIQAPVRLSGDLRNAADVLLVGPKGFYAAKGAAIIAKAHIHMTADDAKRYGVSDNDVVSLQLKTDRPVILSEVMVRVSSKFALAAHIDVDEANGAHMEKCGVGILRKDR